MLELVFHDLLVGGGRAVGGALAGGELVGVEQRLADLLEDVGVERVAADVAFGQRCASLPALSRSWLQQ